MQSDVLPALISVHLGSEMERPVARAWGKCPYNEAKTLKLKQQEMYCLPCFLQRAQISFIRLSALVLDC